ncbi:MurR/RpiR family transcriptional regulator [Streptomyces californicus]
MTRSMQLVAEAVAGDPAGCAALTVTGLADARAPARPPSSAPRGSSATPATGTSRLALAGLAAHQESGRNAAVTADIAVDDPIADAVAKLAYDEQQTLADTAAGLDTVQWGAAVAAASTARRIDVYGVGASSLVGQDLAQKLLRIGLSPTPHDGPAPRGDQRRAAPQQATWHRDHALRLLPATSSNRCGSPSTAAPPRCAITGRPDGPVVAERRPRAARLHRPRERAAPGRSCRAGPANCSSWLLPVR